MHPAVRGTRWRSAAAAAVALLLGLALKATPAVAQGMAVPVDVQFSLFYRILTYDREIAARTVNGMVICVPFQGRFRTSNLAKNDAIRQQPPAGAPYAVRFVPIDLDGAEPLRAAVTTANCDVIYVTPLRGIAIGEIASLSRERGMLAFTGVPAYLEFGIALGIGENDDRPVILVNLAAASAEGVVFSAQLLRLAQVK